MAENKFHYDFSRYGQPIDENYVSIISDDTTDKFVLKDKQSGMTYTCKFFSWDTGFIGASLSAIYELNKHFDLTKIERDFGGETYEEHLGI